VPNRWSENQLSSQADTLSLKITQACDFFLRKEGAQIMLNIKAFTGVSVAGMSRTLHVAEAAGAATAHPAFWAYAVAGAAAAIPPQRKRRNATATGKSVDRGTT
jgi:hypothetical protein